MQIWILINTTDLKTALTHEAKLLGFDAIGFTSPDTISHAPEALQNFLKKGHHGTMGWMEERWEKRANPQALWPEVRSIILLGVNYAPSENPLQKLKENHTALFQFMPKALIITMSSKQN